MIQSVHHLGVAVHELAPAISFYCDKLGLNLTHTENVEDFQVKTAFLEAGETRIELLEPLSETSPVYKFLQKRGPGFHHIAFEVDDLDTEMERMQKLEVEFLSDAPRLGAHHTRVIFIRPSKKASEALPFHTAGMLVELVQCLS